MSSSDRRLRLVQLVITPTFVVEDGDTLEPFQPEHEGQPVEINMVVSAKSWPTYTQDEWPQALTQIAEQFL